ncbi:MAG: VOC family protein [Pseudomonadota bacterium]
MKLRLYAALRVLALSVLGSTATAVLADSPAGASLADQPPVDAFEGTITFLYYDDLAAATHFYGETLGLKLTMDEPWVKIFRLTEGSSVGLVKNGHGFHEVKPDKPVMLSLITSEVDRWYELLKRGGVPVIKPLPAPDAGPDSSGAPIRGFIVSDPGGYTVEVFSWRQPDAG